MDLLAVDVSVVDGQGRPVADLRRPEFGVTIDGEVREVVSAEFVSFMDEPASAALETDLTSNLDQPPPRLIVMVVDQGNIRAGGGRFALQSAVAFLERLGPADRVMFVAIPSPGRRVEFTTNHALVREALERTVGVSSELPNPFNIGLAEALAVRTGGDRFTVAELFERECGEHRTGTQARVLCEREVTVAATNLALEALRRSTESLFALERLLEELRALDSPKALILVSEGLVLERSSDVRAIADLAAAARTAIQVLRLDLPRFDVTHAVAPPTPERDQGIQVEGLDMLAGMSGGTVHRVVAGADLAFDRIHRELSGYYLLGVQTTERDRDGRRRQIRVEVRRRAVTVRARREFRWEATTPAARTVAERLGYLLRSPVPARDLSLRVASYAYRDDDPALVRVVIAAEIDQPPEATGPVTLAFALFDQEGRVTAATPDGQTVTRAAGHTGPLIYATGAAVAPGTYTLKLAAIDEDGHAGSVEHAVRAWHFAGPELVMGDLLLGELQPGGGGALQPGALARVSTGRLAVYTELYADDPGQLAGMTMEIEVAGSDDAPALLRASGHLDDRTEPGRVLGRGGLDVGALPPGPYFARAVVADADGQTIGRLTRRFVVVAPTAATEVAGGPAPAAASPPVAAFLPAPAGFDLGDALQPEALRVLLAPLEQEGRAPAVKAAIARARAGSFDGTARAAFEGGDQLAAAFLRGLEVLARDDIDGAARHFSAAVEMDGGFVAGAFYLGACFAAAGRDRQATVFWQRAVAGDPPAALPYRALGEAWLRLAEPQRAVAPLEAALARWPEEDSVRRSLAIAYLGGGQPGDALGILDAYLTRHPSDHELLLAAMHAIYQAHADGRSIDRPDEDRARLATYVSAYREAGGPQQPLVERWLAALDEDRR